MTGKQSILKHKYLKLKYMLILRAICNTFPLAAYRSIQTYYIAAVESEFQITTRGLRGCKWHLVSALGGSVLSPLQYQSLCVFMCVSVCLSVCVSVCVPLSICVSLLFSVLVFFSASLSVSLLQFLSVCQSLCMCPSVSMSLFPSASQFPSLSLPFFIVSKFDTIASVWRDNDVNPARVHVCIQDTVNSHGPSCGDQPSVAGDL